MIRRKLKEIEYGDKFFLTQENEKTGEEIFEGFQKSINSWVGIHQDLAMSIERPFVNRQEYFDQWLKKQVYHGTGSFNLENLQPSISLGPTLIAPGGFRNGDRFQNNLTKFHNIEGNYIRIKQWHDFNPFIKPVGDYFLKGINQFKIGEDISISYNNETVKVHDGKKVFLRKPDLENVYRTHNITARITSGNHEATKNKFGGIVRNDIFFSYNFSLDEEASPYQNLGQSIVFVRKKANALKGIEAVEFDQHGFEIGFEREPGMAGQTPYDIAHFEYSFSYLTDGPLDDIHRTEIGFNVGFKKLYNNSNINLEDQAHASFNIRLPLNGGGYDRNKDVGKMNEQEFMDATIGRFYISPLKTTQRASIGFNIAASSPTDNIKDITLDNASLKISAPIFSPGSSIYVEMSVANTEIDKLGNLRATIGNRDENNVSTGKPLSQLNMGFVRNF